MYCSDVTKCLRIIVHWSNLMDHEEPTENALLFSLRTRYFIKQPPRRRGNLLL